VVATAFQVNAAEIVRQYPALTFMPVAARSAMVAAVSRNAESVHPGILAVAEASPINVLREPVNRGVARMPKPIVGRWVMGAVAFLIAEFALHLKPVEALVCPINAELEDASS
jgi:hypothetical protein